jgi:hypothetical protein
MFILTQYNFSLTAKNAASLPMTRTGKYRYVQVLRDCLMIWRAASARDVIDEEPHREAK